VNPFKFGLIGSTDTHLGAAGMVDEDVFPGHAAGPVSARHAVPPLVDLPMFNPGGLAVLWAEENSRDALFAAMRRREAYGTSGPRLSVRFFGGFELPADLCKRTDFGADLAPASAGARAPLFAVRAEQDPGTPERPGTALERIQIVKGWLEGGAARERVFDVAGSAPGGPGVDLDTCEPIGTGAAGLCAAWRDPAFDPAQHAFYYARVVERPSCRWSQWVCNRQGVDCADPASVRSGLEACCDPALPKTIQERAWTSPIWYTPGQGRPLS
jgi:hypothetical protein